MKKIISFLITLMMLVSFFSFTSYKEVEAEEGNYIYISAYGNDETGDGSESNPYLTFDKALENYSSDKTIYSLKGPVNIKQNEYKLNTKINIAGDFNFDKEVTIAMKDCRIIVKEDDELNLSGNITIDGGFFNSSLFDVEGTLIMNGGKLFGASYHSVDIKNQDAKFIMNDGEISYGNIRGSSFPVIKNNGYMEINGGKIHNNFATSMVIDNKGVLVINDGAIENNETSNSYASTYIGIIVSSGENASLTINGGIIKNNKGNVISVWSNKNDGINLVINGGEIINNNTNYGAIVLATDNTTGDSRPDTGRYVTAEINDGHINNNTCKSGGCAITLAPSFRQTETPSKLIINGGEIKNNVTNYGISGGLYNGTYSIMEINKCNISDNTYQGITGAYRGGGIYNDGILKLKIAIINNHSTADEKSKQRGAGEGTCPTSSNFLYFNDGLFLYNNTSPKGRSDISIHAAGYGSSESTGLEQFYIPSHNSNGTSLNLKERLSDGSVIEFYDYGVSSPIRDITLYSDVEYTQDELDSILQNYDVIISNNTSTGAGGGIGSNGTIIIGEKDEILSQVNIFASCDKCIVEQPEKIEVTLYDKNNDKIRDIELLKSENYTAFISGLADIPSYRVEQVSLGQNYAAISNVQIDEPVDNGTGVMVRNINFQLNNECVEAQGTTAKLKKYMVVDKNAEIPSSRFEFSIAAGQGNDPDTNSAVVYPGVEPENVMINGVSQTGHVNFNAGESTVAGPLTGVATENQKYAVKDITLDFRNVTFTEPGVYRYVLTENSNSNSAINNDAQPVRVIDVHIIWNDDSTKLVVGGYVGYLGNVTASPKLLPDFSYDYEDTDEDGTISQEEKDAQAEAYQEAYDTFIASIQDGSGKEAGSYVNAEEPIGVEAGEKSDKYVNNLETYSLTLGKKVTGGQASRDEYFKFNVTVENAGSKTLMLLDMSNAEQSTHANNSTSYSVSEMNLKNNRDDNENIPGNQIQTNDSGTASFTVYLHHGQSIKLDGIPKNATYTITEDESPGYTTKSTNASGTIEADVEALFVNERGGIIPTGIFLSALPALAVAGVLVGVFILRGKSKKDEED